MFVRLLLDAGADSSSTVRVVNDRGGVFFNDTPLNLANCCIREKTVVGGYHSLKTGRHTTDATEEMLHALQAVRRLLLRVEAVHAVSWLWPNDIPSIAHTPEGTSRSNTVSTPLRMMMPLMRRRARRPRVLLARVLLAALFRWAIVS